MEVVLNINRKGNLGLADNEQKGGIRVFVFTGKQALPIEGAVITITDTSGRILGIGKTGRNGAGELLTVGTPDEAMSQSPGKGIGDPKVNSQVTKDGYYTENVLNAQIFPDINSIQQFELIPMERYPQAGNDQITYDVKPQNLE